MTGPWIELSALAVLALVVVALYQLRVLSMGRQRRALEMAMKEQRRSQDALDQLSHLERVATLGELTASLAHELNQPLSAIVANAEAGRRFLASKTLSVDDVDEILQDISSEAQRAGLVLQRLRAMLRRSPFVREPVQVNRVVEGVADLLRPLADRRGSRVELDLFEPLPEVMGDPVQMQQVVLNLMLNGLDAVKERGEPCGTVGVRTSAHHGMVSVAVWDTGVGLEGLEEHIFKPFFTTKPDGLGMGVSLARSLVEAHGGELTCENNVGAGATFTFRLPATEETEG